MTAAKSFANRSNPTLAQVIELSLHENLLKERSDIQQQCESGGSSRSHGRTGKQPSIRRAQSRETEIRNPKTHREELYKVKREREHTAFIEHASAAVMDGERHKA
ncbi:hypothetical protein Z517_09336 [Fonsecaea pedrosoi CBS 271.37]|uniref:Uncharacterized protein n=1 Tax=Fonsecaea pedrosoi CBS 271.37 TaxID=1442368 RepID=A0A0D2ERK9_9EURO|nr:uncharacterized protein Z517_09336 [Fonsecaea pedrosoi CBS 271.37]KIW76892.1 hypothetical protein Z517_09336 [Fonsecaea pedrosoi CBS 271.37]